MGKRKRRLEAARAAYDMAVAARERLELRRDRMMARLTPENRELVRMAIRINADIEQACLREWIAEAELEGEGE